METTKGEEKNTDDSGPIDDGQATTTVPESSGKDAVNANPTPEKPKKMKMADWAEDDSDYDEEEEFNYSKKDSDEEGPCEDDNIRVR